MLATSALGVLRSETGGEMPESENRFPCCKCGGHVPPSNDVAYFDAILTRQPLLPLTYAFCHLLPVYDEKGNQLCVGSHSRAQYLEGQPRDPRPEYAYKPEREQQFREAYEKLQKDCGRLPNQEVREQLYRDACREQAAA